MAIQFFIMCASRDPVRQECQFVRDIPHPTLCAPAVQEGQFATGVPDSR
jgi:hypothetical protein